MNLQKLLEKCVELRISLVQLVFLYQIGARNSEFNSIIQSYFYLVEDDPNTKTGLLKNGLIAPDLIGEYMLTPLGYSVFTELFGGEGGSKKSKSVWTLEEAVEFRDLFPKGVKAGTSTARSNGNSVLVKLNKFSKLHPEFSKELILKAVNKYINEMRLRGWAYLSTASNFIEKKGDSILADICEAINEGSEDTLKSDYKQA